MTTNLGPPWMLFSDKKKPVAILPSGRPGEVANVRNIDPEVVERIVQCANTRPTSEAADARVIALYGDALRVIAFHPGGDEVAEWMKAKAEEALAKTFAAERGEIYAQISADTAKVRRDRG